MENVLKHLYDRTYVHSITSSNIDYILNNKITLYIGFDPTAQSLHVGHLVQLVALKIFQNYGHHIICLIGGGTGMIGDPSGKSEERNLQTVEQINLNKEKIIKQVKNILNNDSNPVTIVDNSKWLNNISLIEFLRDTGKYFSVNNMIQKDSVKNRMNTNQGISFTEFSYSLLQARDFLELHNNYNCILQCGGSDQWGNIVSGIDLIKKIKKQDAYGITFNLLTKNDGTKFGKTENGSIYLDSELTTPYDFYQFWYNTSDQNIERYLKLFTLLSNDEIKNIIELPDKHLRIGQKRLAFEVTKLVHNENIALQISNESESLFTNNVNNTTNLPTINIPDEKLQ